MINTPPKIAAHDNISPLKNQSVNATRKMVRRAATDDSTGEVNEIRTKKDPEKADRC